MKILFLINGKSKKLNKIKKQLSKADITDHEVIITEKARSAKAIIEKCCSQYSHVVAIGGDGTIHEVINGIMASEDDQKPLFSAIPAGTANDFAKTLTFPASIKEFSKVLENPVVKNIDIGELTFTNFNGNPEKAWFNNIADIGIGAAVVEEVNLLPKKLNANIAFFKSIIKAFRKYKNIPVYCEADGWDWQGQIKMLVIANGKYFGSGLCIAPHASIDDGKFAITIGGDLSTKDYIFNLPLLKRGKKVQHPQLFYKEAKEIKITSPQRCLLEADGEIIGLAPISIKILPQRLGVMVLKD
ncbi:MAG: diacylglycerol/lipid kinase family protein [Candidatus Cyclobacteriaceae bacterium M2_1C_046]